MTTKPTRGATLRSDETVWAIRYLEENPLPIRKREFVAMVAERIPPGRAIRKYRKELEDRQSRRDPTLPPLPLKPEVEQISVGASRLAQQCLAHMVDSGHMTVVKEGEVAWYIPAGWEGQMPADSGEEGPQDHPQEATQDDDEASDDATALAESVRREGDDLRRLVESQEVTFVRLRSFIPMARAVTVIDGSHAKSLLRTDRRLELVDNPGGSSVLKRSTVYAEELLGSTFGQEPKTSTGVEEPEVVEPTAEEVMEDLARATPQRDPSEATRHPGKVTPYRLADAIAQQTGYVDYGPDDGKRLPLSSVTTAHNFLPLVDSLVLARQLAAVSEPKVVITGRKPPNETEKPAETAVEPPKTHPEGKTTGERVHELEKLVEKLEGLVQNQASMMATLAENLGAVRELLTPRCGWSWDERSNDPSPFPCTEVAHYRVVERRNKGMGITDVCTRHAEAAKLRSLTIQPLVNQSRHMLWPMDNGRSVDFTRSESSSEAV